MKFTEEQRFNQLWLWAILLGVSLFPAYLIFRQLLFGPPVGEEPMSNATMLLIALSISMPVWLFSRLALLTEIDSREIRIRFVPFVRRVVSWAEVEKAEVVDYGFIGGWGIRYGSKYGTAYNVQGRMGLALELKNGKKLLVGTQKPDELRSFLTNIRPIPR